MASQPSRGFTLPVVLIIALIAFGIGAGVGVLGYVTVMGGSGEASTDIDNVVPTLAPAENNAPVATAEATAEATADAASVPANNAATAADAKTFRIDPEQSEVTFFLQEDLRGVRTDVVGTTSDVGGEIRVDFANPANSQIGGIVINARTLATDNSMRNSAIRSQILRSADDAYEFITFTPTSITGLPTATIDPNSVLTLQFQITGDLHIIEITQPATFEVNATLDGSQISGTATTIVKRSDFNLNIPNVPSVANVTDEVTLTLNFVAVEAE